MKIFCHPSSPNSLKLVIAREIGAVSRAAPEVALESVHPASRIVPYLREPRLPILELDDGQFLFCENAACAYLFRKSGEAPLDREAEAQLDFWLEWEATTLRKSLDDAATLPALLTRLDSALSSTHLVPSSGLTAADVVIWVTLLPVLGAAGDDSAAGRRLENLDRWFRRLEAQPAFRIAIDKLSSAPRPSRPYNVLEGKFEEDREKTTTKTTTKTTATGGQKVNSNETTTPRAAEEAKFELTPVTPERADSVLASWQPTCSHPDPPAPTPLKTRVHPILPEKGKRNILITSALPYVNNVPHLGNIIGCVLSADVFSRYCRLTNENVLFVCGTDEYGTATETKALEEGLTPREICDKYNAIHASIYDWFNVGFDHFGRTTTEKQTDIAQDIFWRLHGEGLVLKEAVDQLHCGRCDKFLADRFVEGVCPFPGCGFEDARGDQCDKCGKLINATELKSPRCKICNETPSIKTSNHLFLDLPNLAARLEEHLDGVFRDGLWTSNAKLITKSWLRDGLKPRCITRDLKWGTPVPLEGYRDKVFYVWFDAPIGYLSITANYTDQWEAWWKNPKQVELFQFMAKDNVPFHSVIFPASQIGANDGYTLVNHLVATEYLNYEDGKFSKSRGVGVFGNDAKDTGIPADVWRFYLLFVRPESQDSAFNWVDFATKNNSELLNNLGNFLNRPYPFIVSKFSGVVPACRLTEEDVAFIAAVDDELRVYHDHLAGVRLRDGIRSILAISSLGNKYIQFHQPWKLLKSPSTAARAATVVAVAANLGCLLGLLLGPYMPETSRTILSTIVALDEKLEIPGRFVPLLKEGHAIGTPQPLFKKIEPELVEELKARFAGRQASRSPSKASSPASAADVEAAKADVAKQGEIVRELKSKSSPKPEIEAAVSLLLDLKRKLAAISGEPLNSKEDKKKAKSGAGNLVKSPASKPEASPAEPTPTDAAEAQRLSLLVQAQGDLVRGLKARRDPVAEKAEVDAAVAELLELKRKMSLASGETEKPVGGGGKKGKRKK